MRDYLIDLSLFCKGDFRQMEKHLVLQTPIPKVKKSMNTITILDKDYPKKLLDLESPPLVLYYSGDKSFLNDDCVSIIGSRKPSEYACNKTKELITKIGNGLVIVSGLAYGIDSAAHKSALNFKTIAVLGNGIDIHYPKSNQKMQDEIALNHCLISEFPMGVKPQKHHFPIRNRIIAALSSRIYIMAAEIKSGTIGTVEEGLKLNREIICLPHNIDELASEGCNILISEGASVLTKI